MSDFEKTMELEIERHTLDMTDSYYGRYHPKTVARSWFREGADWAKEYLNDKTHFDRALVNEHYLKEVERLRKVTLIQDKAMKVMCGDMNGALTATHVKNRHLYNELLYDINQLLRGGDGDG